MKINDAIYQKATDILEERRKVKIYTNTCIRAGLCPNCGGALKAPQSGAWTYFHCSECKETTTRP